MKWRIKRLGVYGDLWTRFLHWGVSRCPWFLEPIFIAGYAFLFFLFCVPPRRAVMSNLKAIHPHFSTIQLFWGAYRVFRNYAINQVSLCKAQADPSSLSWKVIGVSHLDQMQEHVGGLIVMTAHMGNYDVAAPFFAQHFKRKLHSVRAPERDEQNQKLREDERRKVESDAFTTLYNRPDSLLALELTQVLNRGEAIALQGDRVILDVSPMWVTFSEDLEWKLPKGPMVLAVLSQVPVCPIFTWSLGNGVYVVEILPMKSFRRERVESGQEGPRVMESMDVAVERVAAFWSGYLKTMVQEHWDQWYVFEPMFRSIPPSESQVGSSHE